ncbi:MAG: hypothetical protein MUE58_02540 [Chitinophagaceae bacterium]|jgi:hypothetical protein|nr:hypothetical protein [Chitinophagaceae bacterium]
MRKLLWLLPFSFLLIATGNAQVSSVEFGKNRVQYKKFKWRYYQSRNFNTYFSQGGLAMGKIVTQVAEEELPLLEEFVEYGMQRRANIVLYNSFTEMKQSNIGLGIDWQNTGGVTKLVNNKLLVYYDGNQNNLRKQLRQGIARVLVENLLFGDDLGEFAGNQALLDLPKWLTDGYIAYAAENWSPALDDKLKSSLLSGNYKNFYQFAFKEPELAGHAFWHYIAENYRKDNVTYFLYLSRIYKSLNSASLKVTRKKFKELLTEFMEKEPSRYQADLRGRRNQPRGNVVAIEETRNGRDYYRFQANPIQRNNTYAMVEFKKGIYCVILEDLSEKRKILLKAGMLNRESEINPHYPMMAWDTKGSKLLVIYSEAGKIRMFVYDVVKKLKTSKQMLPEEFQIIQDAKYMLDDNTLLLSAVKNGQSDIYVYKIKEQTVQQITNDPYDDLDPSFVAFPNKSGIIFASNRPSGNAPSGDTVIASRNNFNIFLVDNWNRSEFKQITQLSKLKYGQARFPLQYNVNHFTFVSDANGIGNRYAGFFSTKRAGLDTIYKVGEEYVRNPAPRDLDSMLKTWERTEPDSIGYISITSDSTYVFPITNYQSGLLESRGAGDNNLVSEVRREGDLKFLYKLRINEDALRRRNINARPTEYVKKLMDQERRDKAAPILYEPGQELKRPDTSTLGDLFQTEFESETKSGVEKLVSEAKEAIQNESTLNKSRLYDYKLKFASDYVVSGFNNAVLINRFQPYAGGAGPVYLSNTDLINGIIRMGISDVFEDVKFTGGFRISTNLRDNDYFASYQNLKRRFDWGLTYYRSVQNDFPIYDPNTEPIKAFISNKLFSNLYQGNISFPFDEVRSIRAMVGYRSDRVVLKTDANVSASVSYEDSLLRYGLARLEYVHDNTINPTLNIWNGLRYKIYAEVFSRLVKGNVEGKNTFNFGADLRYYYPIYRNFIWAGRGAFDGSIGNQKLIYYVGGVDGWVAPKFNNANRPASDNTYAYQSLALNLRGHNQNAANGNNAMVINSEFRLPILTTFFNKPVNNAFLRNLQVVQFIDLGTAWNGQFRDIDRPDEVYGNPPVQVRIKTGGLGPFVGGYGFGIRSTLLGYFLRLDTGWPMTGFFSGKPIWYFAMGLDF